MIRIRITKEGFSIDENEAQNKTAEDTCDCKDCKTEAEGEKEFDPHTATADEIREFGKHSAERTEHLTEVLKLCLLTQEAGYDLSQVLEGVETVSLPKTIAEELIELIGCFEAATKAAIERVAQKREETSDKE